MKTDAKTMFATFSPWKLFFIVALPGMVSMFAMSIYSVVEGAFLGHFLGEAAFAAVNIAFPIVFINFSLADLVGVGASAPISVALGQKDERTANNFFSCSLLLIFLSSLLMGALMFFFSPALVRLMGAEGELAAFAVRYVRTFALCSPLTTVFFALDNYLRISGYIKSSMLINILMTVLVCAFLVLFIGVLKMDVVGSALASCIAMFGCVLLAFVPFLRGKALLKFTRPRFSRVLLKRIVACGSPVFLNNIAGRLTSIVMNAVLLSMGGQTAVAAYAVLMYANDICQPFLYGMSDALSPAIGFNFGARRFDRVKSIARCVFIGAAVISALATLVMLFLPTTLASLFVNSADGELLALSARALRLFAFSYLFRWFSMVAQSFFSAIEKPFPATLISVASALVFPMLVLAALLPLGLDGIWLNMVGTSVLLSLLSGFLLLRVGRSIKKEEKRE